MELVKFWFFHLLLFPERERELEDPAEFLLQENLTSALVFMVGLHFCSFMK